MVACSLIVRNPSSNDFFAPDEMCKPLFGAIWPPVDLEALLARSRLPALSATLIASLIAANKIAE